MDMSEDSGRSGRRRRIGGEKRPLVKKAKENNDSIAEVPRGRPSKLVQKYIDKYKEKFPNLSKRELRHLALKKIETHQKKLK